MKPKLFHRNFSLLIAGQASSLLGNGILAGLAASKIHGKNIYLIIGALGFFLIPPGILFLLSGNPYIRYGVFPFLPPLLSRD